MSGRGGHVDAPAALTEINQDCGRSSGRHHVDAPAALKNFDPMLSARWRDASLDGIDYSYVTNVPHQAVWMYVPASVMWHNDEELRQSFFDFDVAGNTTELTIENFEYAMLHCDGVSQPRDGPETGWSSWLEW